MGLARVEEVPDMLWIENLEWIGGRNGFQLGRGARKNVSMRQVQSALGIRNPGVGTSQTSFNTAFLLLTDSAEDVPNFLLERIEGIRKTWVRHFLKVTGGRGSMNSELRTKEDTRRSAAPFITSAGITSAASYISGITPGGLVTIFGINLSIGLTGIASSDQTPWPTSLSGTEVSMDGVAVPITSLVKLNGQEQVTVQAPFVLDARPIVHVSVLTSAGVSDPVPVLVSRAHIGLFLIDGINGAILRGANSSVVGPANPVAKGEGIVIFATGLGATSNAPPAGVASPSNPLAETVLKPTVTIGGANAQVLFSGLSPGFVGLYQINAIVPEPISSGSLNLTVTMGASQSNVAKIQVN